MAELPESPVDTIAFICTANICRSVMAHAICIAEAARRSLQIEVYSAGLMNFSGTPPAADAVRSCLRYQTPVPKERSMFVADLPLGAINHFLVMEREHVRALVDEYGVSPKRISLLGKFDPQQRNPEIADPSNQGVAAIERCCSRIRECVFSYLDIAYEELALTSGAMQQTDSAAPAHTSRDAALPSAQRLDRKGRLHGVKLPCAARRR